MRRRALADERNIILTGKPIIDYEEKETWPDREDTWVSTTKMPWRDTQGNIIGTFGISHDITEKKRAAELAAMRVWGKSAPVGSRSKTLSREKRARPWWRADGNFDHVQRYKGVYDAF